MRNYGTENSHICAETLLGSKEASETDQSSVAQDDCRRRNLRQHCVGYHRILYRSGYFLNAEETVEQFLSLSAGRQLFFLAGL